MRKIKFRGWNTKKGMTREYSLNEMLVEKLENNGLDRVWLQFTGLLDRHGKEIYEGDIVELNMDTGLKGICNISFHEGKFIYDKTKKGGSWHSMDSACSQHTIIIGNIYQNNELLK